jgi:mannobiose 2-epimerase
MQAERELKGNILPFWLAKVRNAENGGFFGFIDADMVVRKGAARGGLLTCRILWTFSAAYRRYRDGCYLELATWAYRDLVDHFWDAEAGGFFWTIAEQGGAAKEAGKLVYLQVFGIYALAEYYRATGDKIALAKSIATYRLVERHARDPAHGGYFDALDRNWNRRAAAQHYALGRAPKTVNSHMHILEAYTNLLRAWGDPNLQGSQCELLRVLMQRFIDPCTYHSIPLMTEAWEPIGNAVSYGHDIELSWLILEAAVVLGDAMLMAEVERVSLAVARVTIAEGVDADGGVISTGGPAGYTATDKEWWPQAEAAVGFFNAYQISGESRLFEASRRSWDYIEAKFVDRVHGDWIEKVRRDGTPIRRPKVTLWRCPYHSSRACMELTERVHQQLGIAPVR